MIRATESSSCWSEIAGAFVEVFRWGKGFLAHSCMPRPHHGCCLFAYQNCHQVSAAAGGLLLILLLIHVHVSAHRCYSCLTFNMTPNPHTTLHESPGTPGPQTTLVKNSANSAPTEILPSLKAAPQVTPKATSPMKKAISEVS